MDVCPRVERVAFATRTARKLAAELYPKVRWSILRNEGKLCIERVPAFSISSDAPGNYDLRVNEQLCLDHGVNPSRFRREFEERLRQPTHADIVWSTID